jgi:hypothetical protein
MAGNYDGDRFTPFKDEFLIKFHEDIGEFTLRAAVASSLINELNPDDDDFGGGEPAELHPDISPPGLGGIALDGKFNRQPAMA